MHVLSLYESKSNIKRRLFISIQRTVLILLGTFLVVTQLTPLKPQEVARTTTKMAAVKKLEPLPEPPLAKIAETTVVPDQGTERVFCGSPSQRNWKNSSASNIAIGRRLASERGWTGTQFDALKELWSCESSWTTTAGNTAGSGAYGIPQSLPASKMSSHGADYMTNPETQIRWGLDYIQARYGTPQAALAQHYAVNWY